MRNIKDYKGKNVYIVASSKEEFERLVPMLNTVGRSWRFDHWEDHSSDPDSKYISILHDCFRRDPDGEIIPAREFFESTITNTYSIY